MTNEQQSNLMTSLLERQADAVRLLCQRHWLEMAGRFDANPGAAAWTALEAAMRLHQWAQKNARRDQLARIANQCSHDDDRLRQCQAEQAEDWAAMDALSV